MLNLISFVSLLARHLQNEMFTQSTNDNVGRVNVV